MRNLISLAIAAATIVAVTPAMAQDPDQSTERAPFTGLHAEALAGWDHVPLKNSPYNDSVDGLTYGAGIGYDVQFRRLIVGAEGQVMGASTEERGSNVLVTGDHADLRARRDLYAGVRVGFAVTPSTMIYAKGGYTNAGMQARYFDTAGGYARQNSTLDGYRVGGGIEQNVGGHGFVKVEYRYSHYSNLNIANTNTDVNVDRHQVVAGVGIRF